MKVLIDNGHGIDTVGKKSPDGRLFEWKYTRDIAKILEDALKAEGLDAERITKDALDIPLNERTHKANRVARPGDVLISIHNNAAGMDGKWHTACGFSAHVSLNASAKSKALAKCLWDAAIALGLKGNRSVPACGYIAQNLAICRDTKCPAVLTENLFQDNAADVDFLTSDVGKKAIVQLHVDGIKKYLKIYGNG